MAASGSANEIAAAPGVAGRGWVELGRVLGLTVAAEGVETKGQLALLRELGVDVAQGNLMAAAEAATVIEGHLKIPPETAAA